MIDRIIERLAEEITKQTQNCNSYGIPRICAYKKAIKIVKQVAEEGGWIKCSDRLPELDKYGEAYVLVCMDDEFIATTTYEKDGFELWAESGEVIAWQPLPEPFKEAD